MKRFLVAVSTTIVFATSTLAADIPTKAPPPMAVPVASWTGCYVNAGVGYGLWNQRHYSLNIPIDRTRLSADVDSGGEGWLGRFGGGCDYQLSGRWVVGAFADYDIMDLTGKFQNAFSGASGDEKQDWAWSVGGRVGYLITPSVLTYFDGGYTQTHFDRVNLGFPPTVPPFAYAVATTYDGWFIGGGFEYNLGWLPGMFVRTQYRYASYGAEDVQEYFNDGTPGAGNRMEWKHVQTVTTSLVWRFNLGR
jgi:outer membrane immunogenic protein